MSQTCVTKGKSLAELMRPSELGQIATERGSQVDRLLDRLSAASTGLDLFRVPSMVLSGPPGCGKTSLARLIGHSLTFPFRELSALSTGVKEIRELAKVADESAPVCAFIDEVHRLNKAQQDQFLPLIEQGKVVLIGATTENPYYALNKALLSRMKIIEFTPLSRESLTRLGARALKRVGISTFDEEGLKLIAQHAGGDARRLFGILEQVLEKGLVKADSVSSFLEGEGMVVPADTDDRYQMLSALMKTIRASDTDGALYWGFRALDSGEQPDVLFRRLLASASEDIGNADPRAVMLVHSLFESFKMIGVPEGRLFLAQAITYLSGAPKSRSIPRAVKATETLISKTGSSFQVPEHLRNYGSGIDASRYEASIPEGGGSSLYEPSDRGYELRMKERVERVKSLHARDTKDQ